MLKRLSALKAMADDFRCQKSHFHLRKTSSAACRWHPSFCYPFLRSKHAAESLNDLYNFLKRDYWAIFLKLLICQLYFRRYLMIKRKGLDFGHVGYLLSTSRILTRIFLPFELISHKIWWMITQAFGRSDVFQVAELEGSTHQIHYNRTLLKIPGVFSYIRNFQVSGQL